MTDATVAPAVSRRRALQFALARSGGAILSALDALVDLDHASPTDGSSSASDLEIEFDHDVLKPSPSAGARWAGSTYLQNAGDAFDGAVAVLEYEFRGSRVALLQGRPSSTWSIERVGDREPATTIEGPDGSTTVLLVGAGGSSHVVYISYPDWLALVELPPTPGTRRRVGSDDLMGLVRSLTFADPAGK